MDKGMINDVVMLVFGALIVFVVVFYVQKARRKDADDAPDFDLRHAFYSEPRDSLSPEFQKMFGDFLPDEEDGLHMVRLSLANHGRLPVTRNEDSRPITVVFPETATVRAARYSQFRGRGKGADEHMPPQPNGNSLELHPIEIPPHCTMVFDIAVIGAGTPEGVYGYPEAQDRIQRLDEGPPAGAPRNAGRRTPA